MSLQSETYKCLENFLYIFNQATGDAMTDMLGAELCLRYLQLSFLEWTRLYRDLPCLQRVVAMPRAKLDTLKPHPNHERVLLEPKALQDRIDDAVSKFPMARAFVRPSGTEDVCRLYVEAPTKEACAELCAQLERAMQTY